MVKTVGWKGKMSVRAYVPRNDRLHYLRLIGADITAFETNKFEEKQKRKEEREKEAANVSFKKVRTKVTVSFLIYIVFST